MKNLLFSLAFMLIGSLAFAYENEEQMRDSKGLLELSFEKIAPTNPLISEISSPESDYALTDVLAEVNMLDKKCFHVTVDDTSGSVKVKVEEIPCK